MFGKVFEYITDADELTPPQASNLHFKTDYLQKTFIGGLISMGVSLYVVYVAITLLLHYERYSNVQFRWANDHLNRRKNGLR